MALEQVSQIQDLNEKPGIITRSLPNSGAYSTPPSPSAYGRASDPVQEIKNQLKLLTHRQMREMCRSIFEVVSGDLSTSTIDMDQLPDVLDRFAYGD
jgi:phosphatidylinositol kinase/protein kinase (PI-3  family)